MLLKNFTPLTNEEIEITAPSVFTTAPKETLSERYEFIPTSKVIDFMAENSWFPVEAKEVRVRKEENNGYQKHIVRFRHPEISFNEVNGDRNLVDILLTNSHNGTSSFKFQVGVFRLVCSNGLVIQTQDFGSERVRHFSSEDENKFQEKLEETLAILIDRIPMTVDIISKMQQSVINDQQVGEMALKAAEIKFQDRVKNINTDQLVKELIPANREEDEGNNVWVVFNRLQEKLLNGDYTYINNKSKRRKPRRARSVNNIAQSNKLNTKLFEMAYEYV
jgi:hypothetical protein